MPQFVGLPVIVEAYRFETNVAFMPEHFRRAVRRYYPDGTVGVLVDNALRICKHADWIVQGPSGDFTVMSPAAFEASYAPFVAEVPAPPLAPVVMPERRAHRRTQNV
jgi:hypothetical protein